MEKVKEIVRYEPLPKPEMEGIKKITPDTEEFEESKKAEALITNLKLQVGDIIKEEGDYFIVNPRMVLSGTPPEEYKTLIEHFKTLLTPLDVKKIIDAMNKKTKNRDDKLYSLLDNKLHKKAEKLKNNESVIYLNNQTHGISNTLYHLLSKEKDDYLICYRCAWKLQPIPDQREWIQRDDGEYRVLTDSEADQACEDYLDEDQWKVAVEAGMTTEGYSEWVESVMNNDGRGNQLSSYNGMEEEETVNETDYFIYRTN